MHGRTGLSFLVICSSLNAEWYGLFCLFVCPFRRILLLFCLILLFVATNILRNCVLYVAVALISSSLKNRPFAYQRHFHSRSRLRRAGTACGNSMTIVLLLIFNLDPLMFSVSFFHMTVPCSATAVFALRMCHMLISHPKTGHIHVVSSCIVIAYPSPCSFDFHMP